MLLSKLQVVRTIICDPVQQLFDEHGDPEQKLFMMQCDLALKSLCCEFIVHNKFTPKKKYIYIYIYISGKH